MKSIFKSFRRSGDADAASHDLVMSYINYSFESVDGDASLTSLSVTVTSKSPTTIQKYYQFIADSIRKMLESPECAYSLKKSSDLYSETSMKVSSGLRLSISSAPLADGFFDKMIDVTSDIMKSSDSESELSLYTDGPHDIVSMLLDLTCQGYVSISERVKPEIARLKELIEVLETRSGS